MNGNDFETLIIRTEDLCRRSERDFSPCFTGFLSPEEQVAVKNISSQYAGIFCISFGGFLQSERNIIGFFPRDIYVEPLNDEQRNDFEEMFDTSCVQISGSGFVNIGHRDVLGSLMSLGIKRETIGDIIVSDDQKTAYVAVLENVAEYIKMNLERVARDKVRISLIDFAGVPEKKQRFTDLAFTVSSLRLDAIAAGFLNLSRDKTKKLIASGKVSINHSECTSVDRSISEGDIITVKGIGKFVIDAYLGQTQKSRYRVVVKKYL